MEFRAGDMVNVEIIVGGTRLATGKCGNEIVDVIKLPREVRAGEQIKGILKFDGNLEEYYVEALID